MWRGMVEILLVTLAKVTFSDISTVLRRSWAVGSSWGRWTGGVQHEHMHTRMPSLLMFSFT